MNILNIAPLAITLAATTIANDATTSWEHAPSEYVTPVGVAPGAAFIDRILPMPIDSPLRADTWGGDNVKPRNVANGLEDPAWSYLMISRGGHVWISRDGLQPYRKITSQTPYPPIRGRFEDPVVWRDEVQYHMLVNDWFGRTAFYLRSPDGVDWTVDPGIAYDTTVARNADGTRERWYKFERPNVRQDAFGRATHLYLAVIDTGKKEDVGNDIHGSKVIAIPLVVDRRMEIINKEPVTADGKIELLIRAVDGFEPVQDLDPAALAFGSPPAVDFGRGAKVLASEPVGKDLKLVFASKDAGFHPDDFAGKLLGKNRKGGVVTGFARLPGKAKPAAILAPAYPKLVGRNALAITVENFGLTASQPTTMKVCLKAAVGEVLERIIAVPVPALKPYEAAEVMVPVGSDWLKRGSEARIDILLPSGSGHSRLTTCALTLP